MGDEKQQAHQSRPTEDGRDFAGWGVVDSFSLTVTLRLPKVGQPSILPLRKPHSPTVVASTLPFTPDAGQVCTRSSSDEPRRQPTQHKKQSSCCQRSTTQHHGIAQRVPTAAAAWPEGCVQGKHMRWPAPAAEAKITTTRVQISGWQTSVSGQAHEMKGRGPDTEGLEVTRAWPKAS